MTDSQRHHPLTGSEAAGAVVAGQTGEALKKSTMELGGSDAFIVLEDADLEEAVKWALWGRINNAGQCCVSSKRFRAVEAVADRSSKSSRLRCAD